MLAPVLVFFGVAGLVIGIYFGATRFFAAMDGRKLAQRLREVGHSPELPDAALVMDRAEGPLPRLDGLVNRTRMGSRLSRLIEQSGIGACGHEVALTELFCVQSGRRFRALRMELDGDAGEMIDTLRRQVAITVRADTGYSSSDALMDVPVPPLPAWSLTKAEQERRAQ